MQIKTTQSRDRAGTCATDEIREGHAGPVVVLEPDHVAAGALQKQLTEYGFDWIAIVHDLMDARRMIAAAPIRLAMLSVDSRAAEVLAMAQELNRTDVPLILTSATGRPLVFPGLSQDAPVVARGCSREMLFAAFDAIRLRPLPRVV